MQDKLKETDLSRAEANPTARAEVGVQRIKVRGFIRIKLFGLFFGEFRGELDAPDGAGPVGNAIVMAIVLALALLATVGAALASAYVAAPAWVFWGLEGLIVIGVAVLLFRRNSH